MFHILEVILKLNAFRLVFPRETEGRQCASDCVFDVPSLPLYMSVTVSPPHPLLLGKSLSWYLVVTQVALGQWILPLLFNRYP